jgi:hypothetical protein
MTPEQIDTYRRRSAWKADWHESSLRFRYTGEYERLNPSKGDYCIICERRYNPKERKRVCPTCGTKLMEK